MVAQAHTVAFQGISTTEVNVQVHSSNGMAAFHVVGLPDKAVAESRERIRAAFHSIGLALPGCRLAVNLSPADLMKEGSHYDVPIALAFLGLLGVMPPEVATKYVAVGELALDGRLMPVAGVLPAAMHAVEQSRGIICPKENGEEAAWAGEELEILAPATLLELINHLRGNTLLPRPRAEVRQEAAHYPDLKDIKGQETARRALEIAASGGHNMLMLGPPGSGKSMLASRLPGILPKLTSKEMLQNSMIASVAGRLSGKGITPCRPYRDPHHSCSMAAMVGGGKNARPGEVTLAHNGVLFLDELPEFPRNVLDALRQPLEAGQVTVARAQAHVTYPARVQLVAAMNPCRCGYLGDAGQECGKAPKCGMDYQTRISGPLFDRIDLHVEVPAIKPADLQRDSMAEPSAVIAERVRKVRDIQGIRYKNARISLNAHADGEVLYRYATPEKSGQELLNKALENIGISMRGYHRVLRVARTIADIEGVEEVKKNHIAEALSYRRVLLRA